MAIPDVNDGARTAVMTGLSAGPLPAKFVSLMVGALWPASGEDVWGSIRARVEALINQKIADDVYHRVKLKLEGLKLVVDNYTRAVRDAPSQPQHIYDHYTSATDLFLADQPTFMDTSYQVLLLPIFAQYANLHLALLRDGVQHGAQWQMTPAELQDAQSSLTSTVTSYVQWAGDGMNGPVSDWNTTNRYLRQMQLDVMDHCALWPAFDPATGDTAAGLLPNLSIYSDVVGEPGGFSQSDLGLHGGRPITAISIWGSSNWINSIQCSFAGVPGPRVGELTVGDTAAPQGWSGSIDWPGRPITKVTASTVVQGDYAHRNYASCVQFFAADGSPISTPSGCGNLSPISVSSFEYPGRVLSDIWVGAHTLSPQPYSGYNFSGASYLIFGFRFKDTYPAR